MKRYVKGWFTRIDIAVWGHLSAVKCTGLRMGVWGVVGAWWSQHTWFSLDVSAMTATNLRLICKNDSKLCTVQQTNTNTEPLLNKHFFVLWGVWLWAGGVDKDERPGLQKRHGCWNAKWRRAKRLFGVLWGVYLLYPFVPGIMIRLISHYRIPIDQPVQCDVQLFFLWL